MASGFTNIAGEQYSPPAFSLADYLVAGQPQSYIDDLNSTLTDRLYALYQAAPADVRRDLQILSGARSNERQQQLWDAALKKYGSPEAARKWVAPPGSSQHNKGNAVDFRFLSGDSKKWVHKNAGSYGLYFRMGHEPWHVEPIPNWDGKVPPIPKMKVGGKPPIPVAASEFIAGARAAFQAKLDSTPLPRPRPGSVDRNGTRVAPGSPVLATMSPGLAAARRANPQSITDTRSLLEALNAIDNDVGLSVTPRLPDGYDFGNPNAAQFPTSSNNGRTNYAPTSIPMDQSGVQARATILDEGRGSLLGSEMSPAAPNPTRAPVAGLRLPAAPSSSGPAPVRPVSANANRGDLASDMAVLRQLTGAASRTGAHNGGAASRPATSAPFVSEDHPRANRAPSIVHTGQGIAGTAILPAGYRPPPSLMPSAPTRSGNTLSTSTPKAGNTLVVGRPSTPVGSLPAAKPAPTTTVSRTITNPAYTEWAKKYGDGSQVQTAATGGLITANQLAAIQNVSGAFRKPIAPPPAPPRTITVSKPANTLAAPTHVQRNTQPAQQLFQSAGYIYAANPGGGYTKVGKVDPRSGSASGAGNTLSAASRISTTTSRPGATYTISGDRMSSMPTSVQNSTRWATGY